MPQIDTADVAESCLSSASTAAGAILDEKLEGAASLVDSLTELGQASRETVQFAKRTAAA